MFSRNKDLDIYVTDNIKLVAKFSTEEPLNVEIKTLFDYNPAKSIDEIKKEIIENIDRLSPEKLNFIYGMLI